MNKNGFTLVEILSAIVILSLILVITMTNGFGIFSKSKSGINQIEEKNLIEAAKVFLVDVDNEYVKNWPSGCISRDDFLGDDSFKGCKVKASYIMNNYMDKFSENCDGNKDLILKIVEDSTTGINEYEVSKEIIDGEEEIICSK